MALSFGQKVKERRMHKSIYFHKAPDTHTLAKLTDFKLDSMFLGYKELSTEVVKGIKEALKRCIPLE